jgi:mannan endo-1,4-beta-mannosidase
MEHGRPTRRIPRSGPAALLVAMVLLGFGGATPAVGAHREQAPSVDPVAVAAAPAAGQELVGPPPALSPPGRLEVAGTHLTVGGAPVQLVGINAPMIATDYGLGAGCGAAVTAEDVFASVPAGSLVRVWFTRALATQAATGTRDWSSIDRVVAAAEASPRRPRLIITLATQSGICDDGEWKGSDWYLDGFRSRAGAPSSGGGTYLEFLQQAVVRYGDSPAVAMWEPVNEPEAADCAVGVSGTGCYGAKTCPAGAAHALRTFFDVAGAEIHRLAPGALVLSGALGGDQCGWASVPSLPNASPGIDVLSFHDYGSDEAPVSAWLAVRLDEARALDRPLVVGEVGIPGRDVPGCRSLDDRAARLQAKVLGGLAAGAAGVVLWVYGGGGPVGCDLYVQPGDPVLRWLATAPGARQGYWVLARSGAVTPFGDALDHGGATAALAAIGVDAVDLGVSASGYGYWILDSAGHVHERGDAPDLGELAADDLGTGERAATLTATPSGAGFWIATERGHVEAFGDATDYGDLTAQGLNAPVIDSATTGTGRGYWLVAADGGVFAFGDASFHGSTGAMTLNAPVQGLAPDGDGVGYWLVAADGGVFAFGAPFAGSMGGVPLNRPVTGMIRYGDGYLMVAEDGGVFTFSNLPFRGSLGGRPSADTTVTIAALP